MIRFALEIAEFERHPVAGRQSVHFVTQNVAAVVIERLRGGVNHVFDRCSLASAPLVGMESYPIRRSDCDPMKPGSNTTAALDRACALGQAHESILESVVHIVCVSKDAPAYGGNHRSVPLD
jgi:hypothetical protein